MEDTHLAPGTSAWDFFVDKTKSGIPGLNKGVLDDWLMGMAQSSTGRAVLKYAVNALGEGVEEFISEIAGAYLAKMWNGDERGVWQTFQETLPDALYSGLVGALSSAGLNAPGYAADALQRGSTAARVRVEREAADRRQFEEYKVVLGENAPKTFAEFQNLKYNSGEWEAFKSYKRAIQIGELSALADFPLYEETSREIDEKLVGLAAL